MTKKQKLEHKLGNVIREAAMHGLLRFNVFGKLVISERNQTGQGLVQRALRICERMTRTTGKVYMPKLQKAA